MLFLQLELINAIISLLNYMRMVMLGLYAENREYVLVLAIFERIYSGEPWAELWAIGAGGPCERAVGEYPGLHLCRSHLARSVQAIPVIPVCDIEQNSLV